jgi:PhoPQ-activated pathogenicity-related protein
MCRQHYRLAWSIWFIIGMASLAFASPRDALSRYLATPEPSYGWSEIGKTSLPEMKVYDLVMTSQVWQGITWRHDLHVVIPNKIKSPRYAVLMILPGNGEAKGSPLAARESQLSSVLASTIGVPVAFLTHVPNQPLFGNLREDALISYTFVQYIETGDETWPLLLPMTKSAIKAMDTVQALMRQEKHQNITSFVVTGASKRGWTTWLTAASGDKRVKAIVPMVIDTLNLPLQLPHQIELWGKYSEQIDDYTKRSLQEQVNTPRGRDLAQIVDPYTYRKALTLPKLIVNGANDRYWATDATSYYWDGLPNPKALLDVPNSGHDLQDVWRVINTSIAFFRSVTGNIAFPSLKWRYTESDKSIFVLVQTSPPAVGGLLWTAHASTRDFRDAVWQSSPLKLKNKRLIGEITRPVSGYVALFAEVSYKVGQQSFTLSSIPRICAANKKIYN